LSLDIARSLDARSLRHYFILCRGKIEKRLGMPITTRNWNTIEKVIKILHTA